MKVKRKSKLPAKPELVLRIVCTGKIELGPGRVKLLELLDETGSISEAARKMRMSYMKAWILTKSLKPLVTVARGGARGGGAVVTDAGYEAIRLYRRMESDSRNACKVPWSKLARLLAR